MHVFSIVIPTYMYILSYFPSEHTFSNFYSRDSMKVGDPEDLFTKIETFLTDFVELKDRSLDSTFH